MSQTAQVVDGGVYRIKNEDLNTDQAPTEWIAYRSDEERCVLYDRAEWESGTTAKHEIQPNGQITCWGRPIGLTVADLELIGAMVTP